MASVALIPALALIAGASLGLHAGVALPAWVPLASLAVAVALWRRGAALATVVTCAVGFGAAGATLAVDAADAAIQSTLRRELDRVFPGFAIDRLGPEPDHDPVPTRAVLVEDAVPNAEFVALRVRVVAVRLEGEWRPVSGGALLTVGGSAAADRAASWRAGRTIAAPVTFRRPPRYLNEGVPDAERDLALGGTALFGSIKSGLLVDGVARGGVVSEAAAIVRAHVRSAVRRHIAPHDTLSGAVVTAVLIGDRSGLPDEVRERLQAAGTYHVIAISGGNIAILAALALGALWMTGIRGRGAAAPAIVLLIVYSQIVTAGPSVWRATLMAVVYLAARLFDQRTSPWQAGALAVALMTAVDPLEIRDPGFLLTYGATVALLEGAALGRALRPRRRIPAWLLASVLSSAAVEIVLLPISASYFSRVTSAGLVLNLLAVPTMAVGQVAGLAVVLLDAVERIASPAGWIAHAAASLLTDSARLVEVAPWLSRRVPPPAIALVIAYYLALVVALVTRGRRQRLAGAWFAVMFCALSFGLDATRLVRRRPEPPPLRITMFDVGQSEAVLLERGDAAWLIDSAGRPFGASSFDVGGRVLAPALWAMGRRSLDALLVTHGDPDHMGGAGSVLRDLPPRILWHGIEVPAHRPMADLLGAAVARGVDVRPLRAGMIERLGNLRVRVLHPPPPDWERPRVRNDDSVVLEIVHGEVALLLTGDIGAEVERTIAPRLTPARIRILKVAHHGSRSSSSAALVDSWRPQYALISAGRGNSFGHPTPEVLRRLDAVGARVLRTDRDGQITLETDGREVAVTTITSRQGA